jgi:hypothetical protein
MKRVRSDGGGAPAAAAGAAQPLQPRSPEAFGSVFESIHMALDCGERPDMYSLMRAHLDVSFNGPQRATMVRCVAAGLALDDGAAGLLRGAAPAAAHAAAASRQLARLEACLPDDGRGARDEVNANYAERHYGSSDEEEEEEEEGAARDEDAITAKGLRKYVTPLCALSFHAQPQPWRFVPSYEGGALAALNPGAGRLELRLLRARLPPVPEPVRRGGPSRQLAAALLHEQLPAFELARQLRIDLALDAIAGVHLARCERAATGMSVLTLDLSAPPAFATRRMRPAAHLARAWRRRGDFMAGGAAGAARRVQLIGLSDDLAALTALLSAASPRLAALTRAFAGALLGAPPRAAPPAAAAPTAAPGAATAAAATQAAPSAADVARRAAIVDVLLRAGVIDAAAAAAPPLDARDGTRLAADGLNNRLGGLRRCAAFAHSSDAGGGGDCFFDFVNFRCADAGALAAALRTRLAVADSDGDGDADGDDEAEKEKETEATLGAVLAGGARLQEGLFYSFCFGCVKEADHDSHCGRCHACSDWHHWHCDACDRCSYGRGECMHCGAAAGAIAAAAEGGGGGAGGGGRRRRHVALSVKMERMHARYSYDDDSDEEEEGDDDAPGATDSEEEEVTWHPDTTRAFVLRGEDADGAAFDAGMRAALGIRDDGCAQM